MTAPPGVTLGIEAQYLLATMGLFVVSRVLQRWRIPSAITCVLLGGLLGMGLGLFHDDTTVPLLATLGIVSLFLFAGLEVDLAELRSRLGSILVQLAVQTAVLATGVHFARLVFDLELRPAVVLALALFTPSTGFILDSLPGFGLSAAHQRWVKDHAISTEFLALGALFVTVQSESIQTLGLATGALAAMVFVLPVVFRAFANVVLPYAPRSEFAFLVILALACAYLTRQLGVYYLVGAFVVGVTAVRLRKRLPALASERMLVGIELFASFFIPFYFFKAGLHLDRHSFTLRTVGLGLALVAVVVPVRVLVVAVLRHATLGDGARDGARVGVSLVPTLVFSLVLADILKARYDVGPELFGALVVYALVNTTIPGLVLKAPAVEFTAPEAPREGDPTAAQLAPDAGTHA